MESTQSTADLDLKIKNLENQIKEMGWVGKIDGITSNPIMLAAILGLIAFQVIMILVIVNMRKEAQE